MKHPLVRVTQLIEGKHRGAAMSACSTSGRGRPASSTRLSADLRDLQHALDVSDEALLWQWPENPYWQVFRGETHGQPNAD